MSALVDVYSNNKGVLFYSILLWILDLWIPTSVFFFPLNYIFYLYLWWQILTCMCEDDKKGVCVTGTLGRGFVDLCCKLLLHQQWIRHSHPIPLQQPLLAASINSGLCINSLHFLWITVRLLWIFNCHSKLLITAIFLSGRSCDAQLSLATHLPLSYWLFILYLSWVFALWGTKHKADNE